MTDKPDPKKTVSELLKKLKDTVETQNKPANRVKVLDTHKTTTASGKVVNHQPIDLSDLFDNEEAASTFVSVMVSVLVTAAATAYSGYARSVRDELIPHIIEEMEEALEDFDKRGARIAKQVLLAPLDAAVSEEENGGPDLMKELKFPVNFVALSSALVSLSLAMIMIGRITSNDESVDVQTGVFSAIKSTLEEILGSGGMRVDLGTVPDIIHTALEAAMEEAQKKLDEAIQDPDKEG